MLLIIRHIRAMTRINKRTGWLCCRVSKEIRNIARWGPFISSSSNVFILYVGDNGFLVRSIHAELMKDSRLASIASAGFGAYRPTWWCTIEWDPSLLVVSTLWEGYAFSLPLSTTFSAAWLTFSWFPLMSFEDLIW
jgi:hypothetical protein